MARISRIVVPTLPHHITQRGVRSMDVFHSDENRHAYLTFVSEEATRFGTDILAWCLMTNHVHFIAVPSSETSLARTFGEAHRRYTCMKNLSQGVRGYLFQGRFASCVLDEQHLFAAARCVALNPVHAGLAATPWDYPWSSASYLAGLTDHDPLVTDRSLQGLFADWRGVLSSEEEADVARLRLATRTGRPAGDENFVAVVESMTGRNLQVKLAGRPRKQA